MEYNVKELFCENSFLIKRYKLNEGLVHHIQLFYEMFNDYYNINEDIEVLIPCIFIVLEINGFDIDLKSEVRVLASHFFEKAEVNQRQMKIYENYMKLADYYLEHKW